MPRYAFRCPSCGQAESHYRAFADMDQPTGCGFCGTLMTRQFTPSPNMLIPLSFRAVLRGGAVGGGQLGWSDFHSVSEKELAHLKDDNGRAIEVEPVNRARSRAGHGETHSQQLNPRLGKEEETYA